MRPAGRPSILKAVGGVRTILLCAGALALAGCALVSGLSNLDVGDASVGDASVFDVTVDVTADKAPVEDTSTDAGSGLDVVIAPDVSPPPTIAIRCGPDPKKLCAQPSICCRRTLDAGGYTQTCESPQTCPLGGPNGAVPITCDGPSACKSNEVCCAYYASVIAPLNQIKCTTTKCDNYTTEQRMCGTDGGPPSACLQGDTCSASTGSLPGYYFCN